MFVELQLKLQLEVLKNVFMLVFVRFELLLHFLREVIFVTHHILKAYVDVIHIIPVAEDGEPCELGHLVSQWVFRLLLLLTFHRFVVFVAGENGELTKLKAYAELF